MSLHGSVVGIPQTERAILATTSVTTLLEASERGNVVHTIYVADASGSGSTIILEAFDGTTAYKLTGTITIAAAGQLWLNLDQFIDNGWSIRATAGHTGRLHTHVTHSLPT